MSRIQLVLGIILLIQSIYSQPYYVSKQDYNEYANPYTDSTGATIKVAYPIRICTRRGHHLANAIWSLFECSGDGTYITGPCDNVRTQCESTPTPSCTFPLATSVNDASDGSCQASPNGVATTSTNYVEINFYCGHNMNNTFMPNDCPSDTGKFTDVGYSRLATNQCVDQGNGEWMMATCNNVSAAIEIHNNIGCTNQIGTHASYSRSCEKYANPQGNGYCVYYRRVTACLVDGSDILAETVQPTKNPTTQPTENPTFLPTTQPTTSPTKNPTQTTLNPSTQPTTSPTNMPSRVPTLLPTRVPSQATLNPTTGAPTDVPIEATEEVLEPEETILGAEQILSGLNNISLIYIVCGILFVFYLFICFYIWFNERKKREALKQNFQSEEDKDERKEYLRKRNLVRRLELQGMSKKQAQKQAERMIANGNYQQMGGGGGGGGGGQQAHNVNRNKPAPIDQQLMYEGR